MKVNNIVAKGMYIYDWKKSGLCMCDSLYIYSSIWLSHTCIKMSERICSIFSNGKVENYAHRKF